MTIFSKATKPSIEALQKEHPDIYQDVLALGEANAAEGIEAAKADASNAGKSEGLAAGLKQGEIIGAKKERERILAVEASGMPGHEKLIATLKADGTTTGPEAAAQVVKAENDKRASGLSNLNAEAPAPVAAETTDTSVPEAKTPDEALKAAWDGKDGEALKATYGKDGYDSYVGYYKADATFQKTGKVTL